MNYQPQTAAEQSSSSMALASMISGIIGLLLCFIPIIGLIAPGLAIMFAVLGRGYEMKIRGQGLAGLIMGVIGIIGSIIFLFVIIFALMNYAVNIIDPSLINGYM